VIGPVPRAAIRGGALSGVAVVYMAFVGLIERLATLAIVGRVEMSTVLMLLPAGVAGWVVTRSRVIGGERRVVTRASAVEAGAIAGLVGGLVVAVTLAVIDWIGVERVRQVFVAVSPTMMSILRFHQSSAVLGTLMLVAATAAAGAIGGSLRVLPESFRRPVAGGLVAVPVVALLEQLIAPAFDQLNIQRDWLYSPVTSGLTWLGAAVVFVLAVVASRQRLGARLVAIFRAEESPGAEATTVAEARPDPPTMLEAPVARGEERSSPVHRLAPRTKRRIALAVVAALLIALPYLVGTVVSRTLGSVGIYLLLGLGLNIVVGYAGLLDLGYVAFFAVGAYATALLTGGQRLTFTGYAPPVFGLNLSFYVALPIVVAIAALIGLMIGAPVLRLRGDYLAIVTLGFGEIARVLFGSAVAQNLFGGAQGMGNVTQAPIPGLPVHFQTDPRHFYYLVLVFCLFAIFVSWRLQGSRIGRAWNAMREDEQVADAMGISTTRYKLLAFAIGGAIGSLGGALFAVSIGSLTIATFQILVSITALSIVILGGLGSIPGVVVGALVLIGLPNVLLEFQDYRLLIYGAVLIAIMLLRPQGLVPNVRRSRELQEDERLQDQWSKHLLEQDATDAPEPTGGALT
jgi:branched-chain amino acid transport system permease protein